MSHKKTVEKIYEAFGRGDIPAILNQLAGDVEWEYAYREAPNPVPWLQPRNGRNAAGLFFESLGAVEFHGFTPTAILENGKIVVALINIEFTVKKTGKRVVETDEAHVWHFNDAGKVARFRHCADTFQHVMAYNEG